VSNSYYQFCVEIENLGVRQVKWLNKLLTFVTPEKEEEQTYDFICRELGLTPREVADWISFPDFEWRVMPGHTQRSRASIVMYSNENGSLEQVALVAHALLKKFNRDDVLWFTAAATSSKSRVNEFVGDSVWVTKRGCYWSNPVERAIHDALKSQEDQTVEFEEMTVSIHIK
jgi:hypothetical protein